jgi:isochorismate hydrolase
MKISKSLILAILFIFPISLVQAGVIIKSSERSKHMNLDMTTTIYIEKDRLRVETADADQNQVIIFRGDKNLFWMIDNDKKTYSEMTQKDMEKLKVQMDNAQKMMQEQMKNMPEEQRKMMEKMMPGGMSKAKKVKTEYRKKSSGVKVGKWSCTHYEEFKEGKKSGEMWTADWNQIDLDRKDMQAMGQMGKFFEALSQDASDLMQIGSEEWEKEHGISGMPVRWIDYKDGESGSEGAVNEILKQNIKPSFFEIPSGYPKGESPWDQQGGPGASPF